MPRVERPSARAAGLALARDAARDLAPVARAEHAERAGVGRERADRPVTLVGRLAPPADWPAHGAADRAPSGMPDGGADAALVRRVLDGDARAFTTLVDRHADACLRFATRMLGDAADAEDVVQETFVRVHQALGRYEEREAFRTWVFSVLVNRCRTALARRGVRRRHLVADDALLAHAAVEAEVGRTEWRWEIDRAIASLEGEQREAFLLKHVEELSYDEMCVITGAGVSALKMRVKRACERLQVLLREVYDAR